jgi:hypothetical protein
MLKMELRDLKSLKHILSFNIKRGILAMNTALILSSLRLTQCLIKVLIIFVLFMTFCN